MAFQKRATPRSGWRILIAGTGGQGALTAARLLCNFFVENGHEVVSGQLHGMALRGGSVHTTVMVDSGVSPSMALEDCDCLLGMEPVETVRALPFVSSRTVVFMNKAAVVPFVLGQRHARKEAGAAYPDIAVLEASIRSVTSRLHTLDGTRLAREGGRVMAVNVVMLGILFSSGLFSYGPGDFWLSLTRGMPPTWLERNERAFHAGVEHGLLLQADHQRMG